MKKYLASLMILILSLGSVVNLQAYEENYESTLYYQTYQDDSSPKLHFHEHFVSPLTGANHWRGVTEDGVEFTATDDIFVGFGVTECGVEFRVYKPSESSNINSRQIGDAQTIRRTVWLQGNVTPQRSIPWNENIGGRTWGGTLQLFGSMYHNWRGETEAIYTGTVWAAN